MNTFHIAFNSNVLGRNLSAVDDALMSTVKNITSRYVAMGGSRFYDTLEESEPMRFSNTAPAKELRRLVRSAAEDYTSLGTTKVKVYIDKHWSAEYDLLTIDICIAKGKKVIFGYRAAVKVDKRQYMPAEPYEWERVPFPTPLETSDDAPVVLLSIRQLRTMAHREATVNDFAIRALQLGWRTVQVYPRQLLLVK